MVFDWLSVTTTNKTKVINKMKAPEYIYSIPYPLSRSTKEELIAGLPFALLTLIAQAGSHVTGFSERCTLACGVLVGVTLGLLPSWAQSIWRFHMINEVRGGDDPVDASATVCFECGVALRESFEVWTPALRGRAMAAAAFAYMASVAKTDLYELGQALNAAGCGEEEMR